MPKEIGVLWFDSDKNPIEDYESFNFHFDLYSTGTQILSQLAEDPDTSVYVSNYRNYKVYLQKFDYNGSFIGSHRRFNSEENLRDCIADVDERWPQEGTYSLCIVGHCTNHPQLSEQQDRGQKCPRSSSDKDFSATI